MKYASTFSTGPLVLRPGKLFSVGTQREGIRLNPAERRRSPRIRLQVPMFVRGTDASGSVFLDLTKTFDISATGAFLASTRMLEMDTVVQLTIPAPSPAAATY